jgi:hypothetical protein
MVLRSSGKTGVRAATVETGSRVAGRASAWMVGGARFFCRLFARRSITQREVALSGQVCVVMLLDDGCIAWQWVMAVRLGCWCWRHWAPQTKEAAWVSSRANNSTTMVVGGMRRTADCSRSVTTALGYASIKAVVGLRPVFFGPRTLERTWGTRPVSREFVLSLGSGVECGGIPHLAKNERDMGHPALVGGEGFRPLGRVQENHPVPCGVWYPGVIGR